MFLTWRVTTMPTDYMWICDRIRALLRLPNEFCAVVADKIGVFDCTMHLRHVQEIFWKETAPLSKQQQSRNLINSSKTPRRTFFLSEQLCYKERFLQPKHHRTRQNLYQTWAFIVKFSVCRHSPSVSVSYTKTSMEVVQCFGGECMPALLFLENLQCFTEWKASFGSPRNFSTLTSKDQLYSSEHYFLTRMAPEKIPALQESPSDNWAVSLSRIRIEMRHLVREVILGAFKIKKAQMSNCHHFVDATGSLKGLHVRDHKRKILGRKRGFSTVNHAPCSTVVGSVVPPYLHACFWEGHSSGSALSFSGNELFREEDDSKVSATKRW